MLEQIQVLLDPKAVKDLTVAGLKVGVVNPMVEVVVANLMVVAGPKAVTSLGTPEAWMTMCPL
jgi:hypothetical protein